MVSQNLRQLSLFLSAVLFASCSATGKKPLFISFSSDSTTIIFNGVDPAGLNHLKNQHYPDSVLNELISVLQTPSERSPDLRETPVSGKFKLTDTSIVFNPNAPFVKGADYLVITHLNTNFADTKKVLTNQVGLSLKPLQTLLSR